MKAILTFTDNGTGGVSAVLEFDPPIKREDYDQEATPAVAMAFEALKAAGLLAGRAELEEDPSDDGGAE